MTLRRAINPTYKGEPSKGVYQSYMASVTSDEPISIVPIGEPRKRDEQYRKGGGPSWMFPFVVPGRDEDPNDRKSFFFLIENEAMFEAMRDGDEELGLDPLPVGREIKFKVRGKGEEAQAAWAPIEDGDTYDTSGPAPSEGGTRYGSSTILDQYIEVIQTLQDHEDDIPGEVFDEDGGLTESGQKHLNSLFIQWSRTGRRVPLYPGQLTEAQNAELDAQTNEEEPESEEDEEESIMGDDELPF